MPTSQPPASAPQDPEDLRADMESQLRRQAGLEIHGLSHALRDENQGRLWRFVDRVTRRLSDDDIMDVIVEEFLLELKAERVGYVVAEEAEEGWTFAVSHEAAERGVKRLPLPYMVSPDSSEDYHAFLETALGQPGPEVRTWSNPVKIQPEPHFEEELREEFQAALEEEFGLARFVSCRSAMACSVETAEGGRVLFCVQRVQDRAPWTRFQRELFGEMCRYSASLLEQTRLAEQVRELKDQFSSLIESMPSAIVGMDLLGTVSMWNGKAGEIFGISEEDAQGLVFWKKFPEFAFVEEGISRLLQKGPGAGLDFDLLSYPRSDGRRMFLRASLFTLFGSDRGEVALRVDDVTSAEELRQKLSLSQRRELQGALLEAAGHELQNLMTAAQGRLWLIEQGFGPSGPDDALRPEFEALKNLCARSGAALGRLLALSGDPPEAPDRFEMREAVREAVELCRKTFAPRVNVLLREEEGASLVNADRHQWEQAVLNALLHARGGLQDGVLVVKLETLPKQDDGPGFIRLRVEAKGETPGNGAKDAASSLGWTVARALAEQGGGSASEESGADGTRVYTLLFPLASAFDPAREPEVAAALGGRVLVVQADVPLRETALRLLRELGCEAEGCADGASAVRRLESGWVDLAIVDWDLPVLNGRDTAAVLRTMRPNLRLIFVGTPRKTTRAGVPEGALLLPRSHRVSEFAAAVRAALSGISLEKSRTVSPA